MINISLSDLMKVGAHFGHQTRYGNPKMSPYIYGVRSKLHIVNLDETLPRFQSMLQFIAGIAENRGKILFVGTKTAACEAIRAEAIRCGMPYVDHRWLGGMLTNYKTIRLSVKRLKQLDEQIQDERVIKQLTKKELLTMHRERDKLSACLSGIKNMAGLPDALFIIDVKHEKIAVKEANRLGIPIAAIVDTNSSPEGIDHMVPANDDAMRAIKLYCHAVAETIITARGAVSQAAPEKPEKKPAEKKAVKVKKVVAKRKPAVADEETEEKAVAAEAKPAAKAAAKPAAQDSVADVAETAEVTEAAPVVAEASEEKPKPRKTAAKTSKKQTEG